MNSCEWINRSVFLRMLIHELAGLLTNGLVVSVHSTLAPPLSLFGNRTDTGPPFTLRSVAEAAAKDAHLLESEKRETLKSHVLLEARRARLTSELQVPYFNSRKPQVVELPSGGGGSRRAFTAPD